MVQLTIAQVCVRSSIYCLICVLGVLGVMNLSPMIIGKTIAVALSNQLNIKLGIVNCGTTAGGGNS